MAIAIVSHLATERRRVTGRSSRNMHEHSTASEATGWHTQLYIKNPDDRSLSEPSDRFARGTVLLVHSVSVRRRSFVS